MWNNFINWRQEQDIDNINSVSFDDVQETLWKGYQHNHCGVAKNGRPLFVERVGMIDFSGLKKDVGIERLMKYAVRDYERLVNVILPCTSEKYGP